MIYLLIHKMKYESTVDRLMKLVFRLGFEKLKNFIFLISTSDFSTEISRIFFSENDNRNRANVMKSSRTQLYSMN